MKTPRLAFLSLSLLVVSVLFQPASAQAPAGAKRQPLWKIQGQKATVYLLGSVHVMKAENYPLAAPIEAAFEKSKVAVFESDLDAMEKPELQMKLLTKSALPPGETLKGQLSADLYQRLTTQLKQSGLPAEAVQSLKPGLVAMTLILAELQRMGLDPAMGVDRHFYKRAKKAGKEIVGLESPEFQVDLITGFSKAEGEAMLESTLKEMGIIRSELTKLIKSWQAGDMAAVGALLNKAVSEHPELMKRLMTDRNKAWVPKIEELIAGDKDAIVIVGAGHLAGKDSVVELLEKKGTKVVQQ